MSAPARPSRPRSPARPARLRRIAGVLAGGALAFVGGLGLAGCSGGSSSNAVGGDPTSTFRVVSCSIGCADPSGCGGGEIGLNEPMVFDFNQPVAASTVSPSAVNIVATTGEVPAGQLVVEGRRITFRPQVRFASGVTTFGFRANTDYLVTIASGGIQPLRSTSGQVLAQPFSCVVRVTSEVVDVDGQPPRMVAVVPAPGSIIDPRPTVLLEFSELLDFAPFFDPNDPAPPVEFRVGISGGNPDGSLTCSDTVLMPGAPVLSNDEARAVTLLRFVPETPIPEDSCLSIVITEKVRDLAGTRARRIEVPPMFVGRPGIERALTVSFDDTGFLDAPRSSGAWAGGDATFGRVGGDGRHGDFVASDGTASGVNTWVWSTEDQPLSPKPTMFASAGTVRVTDGRFYFSRMVVPAGTTIDFRGANPVQILVRGECRIDGRLLCNGETVANNFNGLIASQPPPATPPGQVGGRGGAGGGDGGSGGNRASGTGPQLIFDGRDGEDLSVPGSSFWAGNAALTATGGRGSLQFPAHGQSAQIAWYNAFGTNYALETGLGGGGGGFVQAGTAGSVVLVATVGLMGNNTFDQRAASGAAGVRFDTVVTQPRPTGTSSADYYLIGGAGGGGGGSHPALARQLPTEPTFRAGAAGSGGGGAMMVRAGNGLSVGATGQVQARGGNGPNAGSVSTLFTNGAPLPGGGGSGGSVLLQVDGTFSQQGVIDVNGGTAGRCFIDGFYSMDVRSGAGGPGLVRIEAVGGAPASGGNVVPAAPSLGELRSDEFDLRVGFMSTFVPMFLDQQPRFRRYEIDATVDGVDVLYTDDPEVPGGVPALDGQSPLVLYVQSIESDPITGQVLPGAQPGPWRRYVGAHGTSTGEGSLVDDGGNAVRFVMIVDRAFAQTVVVREFRVVYRT